TNPNPFIFRNPNLLVKANKLKSRLSFASRCVLLLLLLLNNWWVNISISRSAFFDVPLK
ncbi:hypothetical protein LINPERHAP1_LOCUS4651, partial [Linum perenne]